MANSYTSTREKLSMKDYQLVTIAATTPYTEGESRSISEARRRLDVAEVTLEYLRSQGLPPIFPSFEYRGLTLRNVK